jgi:hypothetical protein
MLTIGITTFQHRFDKYFIPLLSEIKRQNNDIEVIVAINGEFGIEFNDEYRSKILSFMSKYKNAFPIIYPRFRGLSKLWNNIVINSTNEHILLLNDDVTIKNNFISTLPLAGLTFFCIKKMLKMLVILMSVF